MDDLSTFVADSERSPSPRLRRLARIANVQSHSVYLYSTRLALPRPYYALPVRGPGHHRSTVKQGRGAWHERSWAKRSGA